MKLKGDLLRVRNGIVTIKTSDYVSELVEGRTYTVDIKPYKTSRSLEQNRTAWLCIEHLAQKTNNDKWQIYCEALKNANQEAEYILALPKAEKSLNQVYRVVELLDETREINGKNLNIFKCYLGSSKLDKSQFALFINYLLKECAENDIYIDLDNNKEFIYYET